MKKVMNLGMALTLSMLAACGQQQNTSVSQPEQEVPTVQENQVVKTIMARRSIRKYKDQPIEDEKLREILKCGINAPNGMHKESWAVRVVNTQNFMEDINKGFNAFLKKKGMKKEMHPSYGAPVLIFIAHDTGYELSQVDCGLLGGNIILSAQSMGLGTCCLGGLVRYINSPDGADLLKRLEIPASCKLLYAISLGYPDEECAAKPRDESKVKFIN